MDNAFYQHLLDNFHDGVFFVNRDRVVTLWNQGAENISGFPGEDMEGKPCTGNLIQYVDHQGELLDEAHCPLTATIADGKERSSELFLRHRGGHLIPVSLRTIPIRDDRGKIIGAAQTIRDRSQKLFALERIQELEKTVLLDSLTRLGTRRYIEMTLTSRMELLQRYNWFFGTIFFDVDRFDDLTVRHGLSVSDEILRMISRTLVGNIRPFDFVGRWDRSRFFALIENVDEPQLYAIATKLKMLIAQSALSLDSGSVSVTVSAGARRARPRDTAGDIIEEAERWFRGQRNVGEDQVEMIRNLFPG